MAFSSSSLRNLVAEGIPIASANSLSSVAYQYRLSNSVNVIDLDSFVFDFKKGLQRGRASARIAQAAQRSGSGAVGERPTRRPIASQPAQRRLQPVVGLPVLLLRLV